MKYNELGSTKIKISEIALGCWALSGGSTWGNQDRQSSIKTIHTALDQGVTTFDTAEFYGNGLSEKILGEALSKKRQVAIIITKLWSENATRDKVIASCEQSLKRLKTDYVDLYLFHWPNRSIPLEETLSAMEKLKKDGKIRALGVCNFGILDLEEALSISDIIVDQLAYSLLFRAIEFEILPGCIRKGTGVLAYSPFAQGLLTGKFARIEDVDDERARIRLYNANRPGTVHQDPSYESLVNSSLKKILEISNELKVDMASLAAAWILGQQGVAGVLVGARNPEQISRNLKAADLTLSENIIDELNLATKDLKDAMGPNADMWRTDGRIR